jgi:hypothetical protein
MGTQASVHSIDALKDLRTAMALFSEDLLAALGTVDMEIRRTVQWLQQDRPMYWQNQIKRRREQVAQARAELFRRKLSARPGSSIAFSEQKEILAKAEASLRDAEMRAGMVKMWGSALQLEILEYRATTRRITSLAGPDALGAVALLGRMVDTLESYLRVTAPSGLGGASPLESFASEFDAHTPPAGDKSTEVAGEPPADAGDQKTDEPPVDNSEQSEPNV